MNYKILSMIAPFALVSASVLADTTVLDAMDDAGIDAIELSAVRYSQTEDTFTCTFDVENGGDA